jgi:hypothetical protein
MLRGEDVCPDDEHVVPFADGSTPLLATVWDWYSPGTTNACGYIRTGTFQANARLIAKAWLLPELVEALRAAATTIELHAPMLDTANRARALLALYDEMER